MRKKNKIITISIWIVYTLSALGFMPECRSRSLNTSQTEASDKQVAPFDQSLIELPQQTDNAEEKLISHCGFNISYNTKRKVPNWVAYELTEEETRGTLKRKGQMFQPDPALDMGETAYPRDYSNSGYSRGHLVPAGDMKWNGCAMKSCFYLTNICPQDREMNAGCWEKLESKCRYWARYKKRGLYIVCGPIFKEGEEKTIGNSKVAVPYAFFKAVVQKRENSYAGIAFIMLNKEIKHPLSYFAVSIDTIEDITGLDLFHNLPDYIENPIEASLNLDEWNIKEYEGNILDDVSFK